MEFGIVVGVGIGELVSGVVILPVHDIAIMMMIIIISAVIFSPVGWGIVM